MDYSEGIKEVGVQGIRPGAWGERRYWRCWKSGWIGWQEDQGGEVESCVS